MAVALARPDWVDQHRPPPSDTVSMDAIKRAVCAWFGVTMLELVSPRRAARLVDARHTAMWLVRRLTRHSYPTIGRAFGDRDHTTVIHAVRCTDQRMAREPEFAALVWALEAGILAMAAGAEDEGEDA